MEVVKKLCTAMLVFCLSLAVFVGPAEASYRCALNPAPLVYFPDIEECQQFGEICRQTFASVEGKELTNVYVTFDSREQYSQGISFQIIEGPSPTTVPAPGTSTTNEPVTIPKVFSSDRAFKQFEIQAMLPFDIYAFLEGYCVD